MARARHGLRGASADHGAVRELRDLTALLEQAKRDGKVVAVGAIIRDARGRVFVHRRGPERRFLPGCWDLVGGHVEPGEDLISALGREVAEETGWAVRGDPVLMHVEDWTSEGVAGPEPHREFDFYVEIDGELESPRLERPKHVELRWVGPGETAILDENRGMDGGFIRRIVEKALSGG